MGIKSKVRLILLAAIILRLGFVLIYPQFPPLHGDDAGYDNVAVNLVERKGFLETIDPVHGVAAPEPLIAFGPVYPSFLALVYSVFGHSITAARVVQALVGAATAMIVFRLACMVFEEKLALLAATLTALHPALVIYTGMLLTETLFAFLLTLSVWAVVMAIRRPSPLAWLGAGLALGLTVLVRTEAATMAVLMIGTILWRGAPAQKKQGVVLLGAALVLTVGVWTVRNYLVYQEFILVSANGSQVWISTVGWDEWRDEEPFRSLTRGLTTLERSHVLGREAIKNMMSDPLQYLRFCIPRIPAFWLGSHTTYLAGFSDSFQTYFARGALDKVLVKGILLCINLGLLGFALWGIWGSVFKENWQRRLRVLILCPIIAIATVHFFLFATSRYQVPILPFVLMFSAVGVNQVLSRFPSFGRLRALSEPRR